MRESMLRNRRVYRVLVAGTERRGSEAIEFEAGGADAALIHIERHFRGRTVMLTEDDRPLGRIRLDEQYGFWIIQPPPSARGLS